MRALISLAALNEIERHLTSNFIESLNNDKRAVDMKLEKMENKSLKRIT